MDTEKIKQLTGADDVVENIHLYFDGDAIGIRARFTKDNERKFCFVFLIEDAENISNVEEFVSQQIISMMQGA